jgi:hypothetical protein
MPTGRICPGCNKAGWLQQTISVTGKFVEGTYESTNCGYSWVEAVPRDSSSGPTAGKHEALKS